MDGMANNKGVEMAGLPNPDSNRAQQQMNAQYMQNLQA